VKFFDVTLVGVNSLNAHRLLLTLILIAFVIAVRYALHYLVRIVRRVPWAERFRFWFHQGVNLVTAAFFIVALISIWVGPNAHLATVAGLIGAGVAFALQNFIIAIAGYFVILRGKSFSIGDRIIIGCVRGEVIALDFFQTTVLEMGQPPSIEGEADPAVWVMARQYTGRIVTVSNGQIFKEPIYNYSRDFPFLWEEVQLPVKYDADDARAERILLDVVKKHTASMEQMTHEGRAHLRRIYNLEPPDVAPRVFYRLTDNWIELTVRFIVPDRGIREIKDAIHRDILREIREAGIEVASSTYDIVGLPQVRIRHTAAPEADRTE
jgi:small-conductance mechanosensitive channel